MGERAHNNNIPESPSVSLPAERGPGQRRERRRSEAEPRPPSAESASCEVLLEPTRWILGVSGRFYAQEGEQTAGAAWAGCIDEQCIGHVP